MISLDIPGYRPIALSHLVVDFNGTLAHDGELHIGVRPELIELAKLITIHVVTGNTYGTAREQMRDLPCNVVTLQPEGQAAAKYEFMQQLGADATVAIGNGRNDQLMMLEAALAIAVIGTEGVAYETLAAASIVTNDIHGALGLLLHQKRLIATLRS